MRRIVIAIVILLAMGAAAWMNRGTLAVWFAPAKKPITARSTAALNADEVFWRTFHGGEYSQIQPVLDTLTAAFLDTPSDAVTAAHIAWLHNWRIAERARLSTIPATITDDTFVARRYFEEAHRLNPSDARVLGFLAGHIMTEGTLEQDEGLTRRGYFLMLDAIKAWPEFNLFTGGYVMSRLPADSPQFKEGMEWEWHNLDVCLGERIDRDNPDYTKYMSRETKEGVKRVCWNSKIAPHNLEGFFLNMGDMLVKSGDFQSARRIYANAKIPREYPTWPFKAVLEARIANAEDNVAAFRQAKPLMLDSAFSCMACHQE